MSSLDSPADDGPAADLPETVRGLVFGHLDEIAAKVAERLRPPPEPAATPATSGESTAASLADELRALEDQCEAATAAREEQERALAALRAEADTLRGEIGALTTERDKSRQERAALEADLAAANAVVAEAGQVARDKAGNAEAAAALAGQRAEFEGYRRAGEAAGALFERVWPEWLRAGALEGWKEKIGAGVLAPDAPVSLHLLFSALHASAASWRDADPKTLLDALRDVGRRLYSYLRESGEAATEADCAHVAERWAQAINEACTGRCEVEVPVPGHAANSQWMFFQPRGGSSPDVVGVRSWCVRDAQKRAVHRAEVIV